jgi:chitinase
MRICPAQRLGRRVVRLARLRGQPRTERLFTIAPVAPCRADRPRLHYTVLRAHGLFISITMPSIATGANYFGQQLMNEAKTLGFTPNDYTIMPFDGGFNGGSSQVAALQGLNSQLVSTFGWSSSVAYAHEGFSGMNGRTDSAEYFHQSDFQTVLSFAQSNRLSRFTFWSVNRDRQCNPPDNNGSLSSECSSVPQNPWDFTAYTVAFANSAPVTQPSPPPTYCCGSAKPTTRPAVVPSRAGGSTTWW